MINNSKNSPSINDWLSKGFNQRYKNIRDKIIPSINKVIEQETTLEWTKKWYEIIFSYIHRELKSWKDFNSPEKITLLFDKINELTDELKTKKLYVSYPLRKLLDFDKLNITDKLRDIVIPKESNDINRFEDISWWNCHNWTILYKEIFDKLKINNSIVLFEPLTAHSLLLVEINWKYYVSDTEWLKKFNFESLEIWKKISIWNHLWAEITSLDPLKFDISKSHQVIKYNFIPYKYEEKSKFINFIDNKIRDYFLLEYSNKDDNWENKLASFMITKSRNRLNITINWIFRKTKELSLAIDKIKILDDMTNLEIIKYLVRRTNNQIFKDTKNKEILEWIINKIPEWFIKNLL